MSVCATCNDTHKMSAWDGSGRMWPCTRCPVPCDSATCRKHINSPYCDTTPCACDCHKPKDKPVTTEEQLAANEQQPEIDKHGLPLCSESCPSHDGKRCRLMGFRPDRFCEPALLELSRKYRTVKDALAASNSQLEDADQVMQDALNHVRAGAEATEAKLAAALAEVERLGAVLADKVDEVACMRAERDAALAEVEGLLRANEVLRSNSDHLSSENASLASQVESMAMRIESLAEELAKPEDVRLREVLDALDGRAVIFDGLGARVGHLLDEMDEWIGRAGEAERLAEERLGHANQLRADIEAEMQGRLALRKRLGAREDETMGAFLERLATMAGVVPADVHERGWQWRPTATDTAFAPPFGTIRQCRVCGCPVAGGPTACARCAKAGA